MEDTTPLNLVVGLGEGWMTTPLNLVVGLGEGCSSHYSAKSCSWPGGGAEDAATTLLNLVVGLGEGWRMQSLLC